MKYYFEETKRFKIKFFGILKGEKKINQNKIEIISPEKELIKIKLEKFYSKVNGLKIINEQNIKIINIVDVDNNPNKIKQYRFVIDDIYEVINNENKVIVEGINPDNLKLLVHYIDNTEIFEIEHTSLL